jgi:hypothetical protein
MKRVLATLGLALVVLGCGEQGVQVPLNVEDPWPQANADDVSCLWSFRVVDVLADPATGTPIAAGDCKPLHWPTGFAAWRAGTEVVILDPAGEVVLTTGSRYWMCPRRNFSGRGRRRRRTVSTDRRRVRPTDWIGPGSAPSHVTIPIPRFGP